MTTLLNQKGSILSEMKQNATMYASFKLFYNLLSKIVSLELIYILTSVGSLERGKNSDWGILKGAEKKPEAH